VVSPTAPQRPARPAAPRRFSPRTWIPGQPLVGDRDEFADLPEDAPTVGVVALQGDVLEHLRALARVGARPVRVRRVEDLDGLDGIVIPGGESTTIGKLLDRFGLLAPLRDRIRGGLPVFGTCAGMILLSRELDQAAAQPLIGVLDVVTRRNAFGRQVDSFDVALAIDGIDGGPVDVSFIRAPWVQDILSDDVEVLATVDGHPVVVRQGHVLAAAFHPEVTGDDRLHAHFVAAVRAARPVHG
jgi:pyridoxal 5'-phosphate synthase pdxT subunit